MLDQEEEETSLFNVVQELPNISQNCDQIVISDTDSDMNQPILQKQTQIVKTISYPS